MSSSKKNKLSRAILDRCPPLEVYGVMIFFKLRKLSYYFKKMNLILFFIQLADIYSKITHLNWTSFLT